MKNWATVLTIYPLLELVNRTKYFKNRLFYVRAFTVLLPALFVRELAGKKYYKSKIES